MTITAVASTLAAFGIGIGLAGAPGPVQAVLLTESVRGGIARGAWALAGVHLTFVGLLVVLDLGVSAARPGGFLLRALSVAGGVFLVGLALDGLRSGHRVRAAREARPRMPPAALGSLAILLNPGGWIFLAVVASPLLAAAARRDGAGASLAAALALAAGAASGDSAVVVLGGMGLRRVGGGRRAWILRILAVVLAGLGAALVVRGVVG